MRVFRDEDLRPLIDLPRVVSCVEDGYRMDARGEVTILPRFRADASGLGVAWLGAAIPSRGVYGFRTYVYRPDGYDRREQLVALYDHSSMELRAIFLGGLVGNLRTGAGVAAALHMADPELTEVGLVGTGYQARNTLACLAAVYPRLRVVAWSPNPRHRSEFGSWSLKDLKLSVDLAEDVADVVKRSTAIVLTTSADESVVTADMVTAPKLLVSVTAYRRPEIDPRLFDRARHIWTDGVAQASGRGTLFVDPRRQTKLRPLGQGIEDGSAKDRGSTRIILNTGAPWEEVLVAQTLLDLAGPRGSGTELQLRAEDRPTQVF